jgi:ATP-dependent DNA helicase RecQ
MKLDELLGILRQLHLMGILAYNRPGEGPQMFFHHYRVDSRHLIIDLNRIRILKKRHEARTMAMIAFIENKSECRQRMLLHYFGEEEGTDCGHCDVCRDKKKVTTDTKAIQAGLLETIGQKSSMTIKDLVTPYPHNEREDVLTVLRSMIDRGIVALADGHLSIS